MQTSLIITTYNSKTTLFRVLDSYRQQIVMPDEVIIADDGSSDGTDLMIAQMQADYPCPLKHVWQPDNGFQAARIRNLAVKQSTGDYLIFTDGDCIPHPLFIKDHISLAQHGQFMSGYRIRLSNYATPGFLWRGMATLPHIPINRWRHLIRVLHTPRLYSNAEDYLMTHRASIASCNMAVFRDDYSAVNGFDERFVGWGAEDSELAVRLCRYGLKMLVVRYRALTFHFRHPEQPKDRELLNEKLLEQSKLNPTHQCIHGVEDLSNSELSTRRCTHGSPGCK
jgi:glycosyltransferase involved in cell wall biosynthesis